MKFSKPKTAQYICPECEERHGKHYRPYKFTRKEARKHYQFRYNYPHGRNSKSRMTIIHRVCGCERAYCGGIVKGD